MPELAEQFDTKRGNRPVWVLNKGPYPYSEKFRDETITIPPNDEKKVRMPFLSAQRFLGQPVMPGEAVLRPDGTYDDGYVPKSLRWVELTETELKSVGITKEDLAKADEAAKERAKLTCTVCGVQSISEKGLKIHITKVHSEVEPAPKDTDGF